MIRPIIASALLLLGAFIPAVHSQTPEEQIASLQKLEDKLQYQQGSIELGGVAKLEVPPEFRYLSPDDTATVLTQIWGNPPSDESTLGMLVPAEGKMTSEDSWGVIITYEEDGYVKDDEAAKLDYDDLLKTMQEGTREGSKERVKQGYSSIELVGWAAKPRYDAAAHKMYWAKELKFEGGDENTLNYNIRILGRRGVLVLNAVAGMNRLGEIEQQTPKILSMVNFQEGHRYADFNPATDKVAAYGIAAMVTGGMLAKGGFFKVLLASILAMKKGAIVLGIGLIAALKSVVGKFLGRKNTGDPIG
jgi:uncharacterized membrane-anchored protein